MAQMPYVAAIDAGIHQEMRRDPSVLYFGQNLATTENHEFVAAYGHDRVRVTPISETAEIGMAVGAAIAGLRPVVELYMAEFMLVAMDQVVKEAPRFRYMSGGRVKVPLVLKAGYGFTAGWAGQHTGSIYGMFMGVPGLKIALPATAADAKGLMATAIRDENPVCFFHHYLLTLEPGEVPEGEHLVPFGEAAIRRSGGGVLGTAERGEPALPPGGGRSAGGGRRPGGPAPAAEYPPAMRDVPARLDSEVARDLLRTMWRIRCFEERTAELKRNLHVH